MRTSRTAGAPVVPAIVMLGLAGLLAHAEAATGVAVATCEPAGIAADSFCVVDSLRLHYVDWGGQGPAVILLAGLGDSARIFDDLAPRLNDRHHVVAMTRRGYGRSAAPGDSDYSNAALVADVLGLMSALGIEKATFIGHSIAGGELAALGARHPERVERLVYLDAAYDRSRVPELMARMPAMPQPDADARDSLDSLTRWRQAALGVDSQAVGNNVAQTFADGPAGWIPSTPATVGAHVLAGDIAAPAQWNSIRAPSLALYSSKDVADQVPPNASDGQRRAMIDFSIKVLRPWMLRSQASFIEQSPCASAVEIPRSTHYMFLHDPDWTARAVESFLSDDDPCRWQPGGLPD